jgi:hypothetical protein
MVPTVNGAFFQEIALRADGLTEVLMSAIVGLFFNGI